MSQREAGTYLSVWEGFATVGQLSAVLHLPAVKGRGGGREFFFLWWRWTRTQGQCQIPRVAGGKHGHG